MKLNRKFPEEGLKAVDDMPEVEEKEIEVEVNLKVDIWYWQGLDQNYGVNFDINVNDKSQFVEIAVEALGLFKTEHPMDEEFKKSDWVKLNSPAIAFPFLRSFISTVSINAGCSALILPSYNFISMAQEINLIEK